MSQAFPLYHVIDKVYLINCLEWEGIKIETVHGGKGVED